MELLSTKFIGSLGRFVIPSEIRTRWKLKPNTEIEIYLDGDFLVLKRVGEQCALCGKTIINNDCVRFDKFPGKKIALCGSCYGFLWKKFEEDENREKIKNTRRKDINNE